MARQPPTVAAGASPRAWYNDAHSMESGAPVQLDHVRMAFGDRPVFDDLSCRFPRGRISVILGGSGSGKSTLLRLIGGLVRPRAGPVLVDGEDVTRLSERELYRVRRKLGMMFQDGALLDSLTVFDNLAFPLREHDRLDEPRDRRRRPRPPRGGRPARRRRPAAEPALGRHGEARGARARHHPRARPCCSATSRSRGSIRSRAAHRGPAHRHQPNAAA